MVDFKEDLRHPLVKRWWQRPGRIILLIIAGIFLSFFIWAGLVFVDAYQKIKSGEYDPRLFGNSSSPEYDMSRIMDQTDPSYGPVDAPIQIVEFGDFMCPRCLQSFNVLQEVRKRYPDKIRLSWRNLPIVTDYSYKVALAGECAAAQGQFWPFHDYMFEKQAEINQFNIAELATDIGMNESAFQTCYDKELFLYKLIDDGNLAEELEISGTPTFFINGRKVPGSVTIEAWSQIINQVLSQVNE